MVQHGPDMQTTQDAMYVAGEPAGVSGAEIAFLEGRQAALHIALRLRHGGASGPLAQPLQHTQNAIRRARRFSDTVLRFFEPRMDALARLATADTVVCRCEDVPAGVVHRFLEDNPHVSDINSVKLACRTGMGFCQGRYCQHTTAQLTAAKRGMSVQDLGAFSVQAPVKPVTVRTLVGLADRD